MDDIETRELEELARRGRTRARLERKAEKRRAWADSRAAKAEAATASGHARLNVIPFGQPVHGVKDANYREKARRSLERGYEHGKIAGEHERKAEGLEAQLRQSIYSDDVDAVERLEERIAELEQKRTTIKDRNATYRKEHRAELAGMGAYARDQAMPHAGYELTNLSGNINRQRKRLEELRARAAIVDAGGRGHGRPMVSRFASDCAACGGPIEKGSNIVYYRMTREALHAACVEEV